MKASIDNPEYTVYLKRAANGKEYDLTGVTISIEMVDDEDQIAQYATIELANIEVGESKLLSLVGVRDRIFIYANDGKEKGEIFRGFVWTKGYKSEAQEREFKIKCYDNLIYFQQSEESLFYAAGKQTKTVVADICKKWGVNLDYSYDSIKHSKLVLRGNLSDILIDDILDLVKKRTGHRYVVSSIKDKIYIKTVGKNKKVYEIRHKHNAISTTAEITLEETVTQVKILGTASESGQTPVKAKVKGDVKKYGTIQKLQDKDDDTSLADAKKEAQHKIDEDGQPKKHFEVVAPDIPWIRKGDKVKVVAGSIDSDMYVYGIERNISNKEAKMTLTVRRR